MISRRCAVIISGGLVLMFTSFVFKNSYLLSVGVTLLLFVSTMYVLLGNNRIRVKRKVKSTSVFEGGRVDIDLNVSKEGMGFTFIEVYDELPRHTDLSKGHNHMFLCLRKGEEAVLRYTIECPLRGNYLIGPATVRVYDYFFLFYENYSIDVPSEVVVYPSKEDLAKVELTTLYRKMPIGAATLREPGAGLEFHQIRDYQPSDPMKNINWKVFAKLRELMVNEYEKEDIYDVYVTLDARSVTAWGPTAENELEAEIKGAMGVISEIIKTGNNVTLVTHGEEVTVTKPGRGKDRARRFLDAMANVMPRGNEKIKPALDKISRGMTPRSPVIMFHSLIEDETIEDTVRYLVSTGHSVTVISPIPPPLLDKYYMTAKSKANLVREERRVLIKTLRRIGARVIAWNSSRPLREVIIKQIYK